MRIPKLRLVEWIGGSEGRLFFSSGKVVEVTLPWVTDARRAQIVDGGMGLDPGDGKDVSAMDLAYAAGNVKLPGVVLRPGRRGWVGS